MREISKRLGISRNTVLRYLRAETVEPAYADRRSPTSLDKYTFKLSAWLKTEATKSCKQRRTLKQMHIDLCALGFEGSYGRVAAFGRQWKVDHLERVNSASKSTCLVLFCTSLVRFAHQCIGIFNYNLSVAFWKHFEQSSALNSIDAPEKPSHPGRGLHES